MGRSGGERVELRADAAAAGERLDRWLAASLQAVSRSRIKALVEAGQVRLAGATITDPSWRVKPGQVFELTLPEPEAPAPQGEAVPLVILHEDAELVVLDKPAGMAVHPAPGSQSGTLVNALIAHCGESLSGIGGVKRPGIVHRLDKDTTGIMVVAKTDAAHQHLSRQFAERTVERSYLALVWGVPEPLEGSIVGAIGRDPRDRKRMALVEGRGKPAETRYAVRKAFGLAAALLSCRLKTGRTHQIRVHLASTGHPLIGDATYGRMTQARLGRLPPEAREAVRSFPRQALHAAVLGFEHPRTGERLGFESSLPEDFQKLLTILESLQRTSYT
ncbi:MAG TPA: RluA family pseudouridine synthase [Alphaproteobacteria bacterium]|nr:RluA family pseudouridine synthase [Alphaproteobacteria bacterium]